MPVPFRPVPLLAAGAVLLSVAGVAAAGEPQPGAGSQPPALRVMSFNLRYGTARDGENAWPHRKEFVAETIKTFSPDVLGTQETLAFQRDELLERLPGYAAFGVGREDGTEKGEMTTLLYRTDRLEKLDGGHFWLSETPDEVGSQSWDTSLPRMASWLKLRDRRPGGAGDFWVFNTHFDHRGAQARAESATLMRAKIAAIAGDGPAIVTGDFNAVPGSLPYKNLFGDPADAAGQRVTLRDSYRERRPDGEPGQSAGTAGGFRREDRGESRIDWIAVTPHWAIVDAAIDRTHRDGRTPSDHDPVTAVLLRTADE
ncbi:endonuclease/exonuclease/phosphatase family protein [Alienimonas californiensis]|uniref:Endonuclease/Exonuclease/phosphatase family protein n=1 Tax=Alienimonas californiensis TaxID=2527989 RepID=A0A517P8V5_9PLAN|nr:endonuclease/exonuclease/phosphatase family protein [Alienimonas californiensis]QDT15813.1 Endonuclease/Exonuclease/phosphatase family protein [Alienimonas californiensis]